MTTRRCGFCLLLACSFLGASDSVCRYPSQRTTGCGGYFGYAGSFVDSRQSKNRAPLGVMTARTFWQVSQRLSVIADLLPFRPGPHVSILIDLDVDDVRAAADGAIFDVLLARPYRQVDGHDD